MLRSLCALCLAILLGWSVGVHAGEVASAVNPEDAIAAPITENAADGAPTVPQALATRINALQVPFVLNDERVSEDGVKFFAKTLAGSVLVANKGITYHLKRGSKANSSAVAIKETWIKPKNCQANGIKPSKARFNFFKGADQNKWKRNMAAFDEVGFGQVYDGVFVSLKAYNNNVEKIFSVESGADPRRIAIRVDGVSDLRINKAGELELLNRKGTLKMTAPVAYQEVNGSRKFVKTAYNRVSKNTYGFKVEGYDRSLPLIIDPLLASTFLGDTNSDIGYAIDCDNASIYVTGWTKSADFPIIDGAYSPFQNVGGYDVFVSKLSLDLDDLEASTFLGGTLDDYGTAIALVNDGSVTEVYVAGSTKSSDFPVPMGTTTPFDSQFNGTQDAFLCKLNADLSDLEAATFLGGSAAEQVYAMKTDLIPALSSERRIYVTGTTLSKNFPVLADSAYSVYYGGKTDIFVSAFDTDLGLHYSTLLGGSSSDTPYALELNGDYLYVAGATQSPNFPTTPGSYRRVLNGAKADIFVSRLNFSLGLLDRSTLLGGSTDDVAYALAIDGNATTPIKAVYAAGYTNSVNFPTYTHYTKGKKVRGVEDAFIAKLTPTLTGKVTDKVYQATLVGGTLSDVAMAMKVDSANHQLVVAGNTKSTNFPVDAGAIQPLPAGGADGFVMIVDDNLTAATPVLESTYIGGPMDDRPVGMFLFTKTGESHTGDIYIIGTTKSDTYPTAGGYQTTFGGNEDVFISGFHNGVLE